MKRQWSNKRQAIDHKTLHGKLKIEQHQPHLKNRSHELRSCKNVDNIFGF